MEYRIMLIAFLLNTMQCVYGMFPEKNCVYIKDLIFNCVSKQLR